MFASYVDEFMAIGLDAVKASQDSFGLRRLVELAEYYQWVKFCWVTNEFL